MNNLDKTETNILLLIGIIFRPERKEIFIDADRVPSRTRNMMLNLLCIIQNMLFQMVMGQR